MKEIKLTDIIKQLQNEGHVISFSIRKDGGLRIRKIDNQTFIGSTGNRVARAMAGVTLSENRQIQLSKIRTPKGRFGNKRKNPLPKEVQKALRKAQRLWKKKDIQAEGKPTTRNIRYIVQNYGEEEALRKLSQNQRYALGLAYDENINWILSYIRDTILPKSKDKEELEQITYLIDNARSYIKEAWISDIHNLIYDYNNGIISAKDLLVSIRNKLY